jgi:hypothetical protein
MKASFKTILFTSLSTLAAFFAVTYSSCTPDKCKSIVCAYGGVCNNGACSCVTGYEGTQCETVARNKFLGKWVVFEKGSTTNSAQYELTVSEGQNVADVVITNFNNQFSVPVSGYIRTDSIYLPSQTVNGKTIVGVGYIIQGQNYATNAEIVIKYKVTDQSTGATDDYGYDAADNTSPSMWDK